MKSVFDEGVPEGIVGPLRALGANVDPFPPKWRGFTNGVLLAAVEQGGYGVLLTNDKNMGFQFNLRRLRIAIVALPVNRPDILAARASDILNTLRSAKLGQVIWIRLDGRRLVRSADDSGTVVTQELAVLQPFWQ